MDNVIYRIHVQAYLHEGWLDWFDGLAIEHQPDGSTVLVGPVVDQAALHGLLARVRDLGLTLLSVTRSGGG